MGSVMSLSGSKRKATSQDVESSSNESGKKQKMCPTNDDEYGRLIPSNPDELSTKTPWSLCAKRVINVTAAVGFFTRFTKFIFQQDKKDTTSSSLCLPSPPTSVPRVWKHHVFPSFHGADVRKNFLSHVLKSFKTKGIDSFIDNNIERSKSIGPELVEAIKGSKIAIVLLSRNYASSSWCLNELVEIMKCREVLGQIVIPIFYEVDPTDVKKQTRDFGKAFRKTCKGKTKEHIERWRKALEDVAQIEGEHSRNWSDEAAMIEKISSDISNKLNISTPSRDFDGLIGMGAHMEEMEQLLRLDLVDEVRIIGIWGPPGIGKTTIARFLFNQVCNNFQLGAIMVNIKEYYLRLGTDEYNAKLYLQKQMLSQIINQTDIVVPHLGVAQERLKDKKVLLVLDDVDQLEQLYALAKEIHWFGSGSRIIITTEDRRVLTAHGIKHIYKVKFPSFHEAFEIFCMHAFGQNRPYEGFYELAWEVTGLAGCLPLGLKVLGSALKRMSKPEWERTLPRLKACLDGKIGSIIKFSYDALQDEEKYVFLYIACFFNHEYTHQVEEVLATKFSNVSVCLQVLADKSLISLENNIIRMHTLLQQFGREASREQFVGHGLVKRQLLVGGRDICELLSDDSTDGKRFIGMNFDISKSEEELDISEKSLERMSGLQFVRINGENLAHPERLQSLLYHSQKIISLDWMCFHDIYLPSTFNTEFLVKVVMTYSNKLQKLWEGTKQLRNLKWMDLSYTVLKELPDFSTANNLEEIILDGCSSLVELPSSIGKLTNLQVLNLKGCSRLVKLPSSIKNATSLKDLDLSCCYNLVELPSIGNATKLERLNLSYCSNLVKLPSLIEATNLQILSLENCSRVLELPAMANASNLEILNLNNCSSLVELPAMANASNLEILNLKNCSSLLEIPPFIGTATNLQTLDISGCSSLLDLPPFVVTNLRKLDISRCSSLLEIPPFIGTATNLQTLDICGCSSLLDLPPFVVTNLWKLDIRGCSSLVKLPCIGDFTNLEQFDPRFCLSLVELPLSIGTLTKFKKLDLSGCRSLLKLPSSIGDLTNLETLELCNCSSLLELPHSIGTATKLKELNISGCRSLVKLPSSIGDLTNLEELKLYDCSSLLELPRSIGTARNINTLNLSGCRSLVKLPSSIGDLTNLEELKLYDCSSLLELPHSIGTATNINTLNLSGCRSLVKLPSSIGDLTNLEKLKLYDCSSLLELPHSIGTARNINTLNLNGCRSLVKLPSSIGDLTNLEKLKLCDCSSLLELPHSIGTARNLKILDIGGCSSYVELPSFVGNLQGLYELSMCGWSKLEAFPTNVNLESLERLDLTDCSQLKTFPEISTIIKYLNLKGTAVKDVPLSIMSWSRLSEFHMSYSESLKEFPQYALDIITDLHLNKDIQEVAPWVKRISRLRNLILRDCNNLVSLPQFSDSLSYLDATNCKSLERLDCSFNNPWITLDFTNCFKLNQEARDLIMHPSTRGSAILPGSQVPACFDYRATGGSSLTVKLNERHLSTSLKFKACIMLVMDEEETGDDEKWIWVDMKIKDKQNDKTSCAGGIYYIDQMLTDHIYTFKVEAEKVTSTEFVLEFILMNRKLKIGECGLLQIGEVPSSK